MPILSGHVSISGENGVIVINAASSCFDRMRIIGKTPGITSSRGKNVIARDIALEFNSEAKDLEAIAIQPYCSESTTKSFIVTIRRIEGPKKIYIDGSKFFVSLPGRLMRVDDDGTISVEVFGVIYINKLPEKLEESHPEYRLVDTDSLLQYAIEQIGPEELAAASTKHIAALTNQDILEKNALYIAALEESLANERKGRDSALEALREKQRIVDEVSAELEEKCSFIQNLVGDLQQALGRFENSMSEKGEATVDCLSRLRALFDEESMEIKKYQERYSSLRKDVTELEKMIYDFNNNSLVNYLPLCVIKKRFRAIVTKADKMRFQAIVTNSDETLTAKQN